MPPKMEKPKELSIQAHMNIYRRALNACGIVTAKLTHLPRGCGARTAEMRGADSDQLSRMAGWARGSKNLSYTNDLPLEPMRALADFPVGGRGFFLARAIHEPPLPLAQQIFPWVDEQMKTVTDIAGRHFLRLLKYLRIVILQDAPLLQEKHPNHPIWTHTIFSKTPQYQAFAALVKKGIQRAVDPSTATLQQVVPDVASSIEACSNNLSSRIASLQSSVSDGFDNFNHSPPTWMEGHGQALEQITQRLGQMQAETAALRAIVAGVAQQEYGSDHKTLQDLLGKFTTAVPPPLQIASIAASTGNAVISTGTSSAAMNLDAPLSSTAPNGPVQVAIPSEYKLNRTLSSVIHVWEEYDQGFAGGPAVKSMDAVYKATWRKSTADRKYYSERRVFYDYIRKQITETDDGETIARRLEATRIEKGMSLNAFCQWLKTQ